MNATHSPKKMLAAVGLFSLGLVAAGCAGDQKAQQKKPEPPESARPLLKREEEARAKRQAVQAEYKAMQIPDLARRLEGDSAKGVEPFNSVAYREVVSRGAPAGRELAALVRNPDRSSFLTLLAVRKADAEAYRSISDRTRAAILADALRTSKSFNEWGLPHLYWEDAAKAVIELREAAVEPLRPLLADKRPAPVWGSEEHAEYQRYKYRVADYAWALLREIRNQKVEIPEDPAARDRLIAEEAGGSPRPR